MLALPFLLLALPMQDASPEPAAPLTADDARAAARVVGLPFTDAEIGQMLSELADTRAKLVASRGRIPPPDVLPALRFDPLAPGIELRPSPVVPRPLVLPEVDVVPPPDELVYADIATLAALVRSRRVSCVELTDVFLARLHAIDETLNCVVTFTDERAREQARRLDAELAEGRWRGPLHGIPWGAKDLLATRGIKTTWGAAPYAGQLLDEDATVVERLDEAGAVLIAKLTLGALAYGDVWFGGMTRNPWDPEQGSSGSSAGPAAAVVAGGVAFAIGSETYGSIVSPSNRCGASSLRPTFGRVSRHGAMALCWSLDKLGPMARSAQDAALVFDAIYGPDGRDPTVHDLPFTAPGDADVRGLVVGFPRGTEDELASVLEIFGALGVETVPVALPDVSRDALNLMLVAEAATAFDELTRDGRDDQLTRQDDAAWPNLFRAARMLPAVEYLQSARRRTEVMLAMDELMGTVDALVHPNYAQAILEITNHTGHPTAVVPAGFDERERPWVFSITGGLFDETTVLALAQAWQRATDHHRRRPPL